MRLVRYGEPGRERPGFVDPDGQIRDLSDMVVDISSATLEGGVIDRLSEIDWAQLPIVAADERLGCPVAAVRQMIGIGLNYRAHAEEGGLEVPAEPLYFMKAISSINGPNDDVVLPPNAEKADWEIELGVVIGKRCAYVDKDAALDHVAGYVIGNDVSERAFQIERGSQWAKGKGCETFGPLGPWLVTADEVPDPQNLEMRLYLNGELVQSDSTANMIFAISEIISTLSRYMVLLPGDVILTGTPSGVGFGMSPQRFLRKGDRMRLEIDGLGIQEQVVV